MCTKKIFFRLLFIVVTFRVNAQEIGPPSLAVGAGEVLFEKGKLDAELIANIISTKQDEIKKELASRLILQKLTDESYTVWNFANKNINVIFKEENADVIKKELLKNASELMITVAFLEFYLQTHYKSESKKYIKSIQDVLDSYDTVRLKNYSLSRIERVITEKKRKELNKILPKAENVKKRNPGKNKDLIEEFFRVRTSSTIANGKAGTYFAKPYHLYKLREYESLTLANTNREIHLNYILLDMVYEIVSNNSYLQQRGLFNEKQEGTERELIDQYSFIKANATDSDTILVQQLQHLERLIREDLNYIAKYSYALSTMTSTELDELSFLPSRSFRDYVNDFTDLARNLKEELREVSLNESSCEACNKEILKSVQSLINQPLGKTNILDDDLFYFIREKAKPEFVEFNIFSERKVDKILLELDNYESLLKSRLYQGIISDRNNLQSFKEGSDILYYLYDVQSTFIKVFNVINNLDQVESYEVILKFIADLGEVSKDNSVKKITSSIARVSEKYSTISRDSNRLDIDVESIYLDLYKRFAEENSHWLTLYFSVGLNYVSSAHSSLVTTSGSSLDPFTFVGEKIGLKFKVHDWARKSSLLSKTGINEGDIKRYIKKTRKPIVNDLHFLIYGSGLLYQVEALKTENDFENTLIGVGFGPSFFNGLDLNAFYAFPADGKWNKGLFGFSFDIKITEYLSELTKKRRLNKYVK